MTSHQKFYASRMGCAENLCGNLCVCVKISGNISRNLLVVTRNVFLEICRCMHGHSWQGQSLTARTQPCRLPGWGLRGRKGRQPDTKCKNVLCCSACACGRTRVRELSGSHHHMDLLMHRHNYASHWCALRRPRREAILIPPRVVDAAAAQAAPAATDLRRLEAALAHRVAPPLLLLLARRAHEQLLP